MEIKMCDCKHCNSSGILPMEGHICPNCKKTLNSDIDEQEMTSQEIKSIPGHNIKQYSFLLLITAISIYGGIILADSLSYIKLSPPKGSWVIQSGPGLKMLWIQWSLDIKEMVIGLLICAAGFICSKKAIKGGKYFISLGIILFFTIIGLFGKIEIHNSHWFTSNVELVELNNKGEMKSTFLFRSRYVLKKGPTVFHLPGNEGNYFMFKEHESR